MAWAKYYNIQPCQSKTWKVVGTFFCFSCNPDWKIIRRNIDAAQLFFEFNALFFFFGTFECAFYFFNFFLNSFFYFWKFFFCNFLKASENNSPKRCERNSSINQAALSEIKINLLFSGCAIWVGRYGITKLIQRARIIYGWSTRDSTVLDFPSSKVKTEKEPCCIWVARGRRAVVACEFSNKCFEPGRLHLVFSNSLSCSWSKTHSKGIYRKMVALASLHKVQFFQTVMANCYDSRQVLFNTSCKVDPWFASGEFPRLYTPERIHQLL